jgi:hypothetical protein
VRFQRTDEGTIKTLDYAGKQRRWSTKRWLAVGTLAALAAGVGNLIWQRRQPPPQVFIAGAMLCPTQPDSSADSPELSEECKDIAD